MEPKFLVGLWTVLRSAWWALHQLPFLLPAPPTAASSLARLLTVRAQRLAFEAAAEQAFAWDRGPWWLGRVGRGFGGGAVGSVWRQKQPRARGKGRLHPPTSAEPQSCPLLGGRGKGACSQEAGRPAGGEQSQHPQCPWVQGPPSCAGPWRGHLLPGLPPEGVHTTPHEV